MNLQSLYTEAFQKFVQDHLDEDPALLLFKYQGKTEFDLKIAVQQIQSRKKSQDKLPSWAANPSIIFPVSLSLEQCSSEETAKFKADQFSGEKMLDLTTGFGVDAYYMGQNFEKVTCIERNDDLAKIVRNNFELLSPKKYKVISSDAMDYLKNSTESFDLIYLDPDRRGSQNQKFFKLSDCDPDVMQLRATLLERGKQVLIKTSPMLDIKGVIRDLPEVQKIWVLSVKNEVKEVLLYWNSAQNDPNTEIICVNLFPSKQHTFHFEFEDEESVDIEYGSVGKFLIEPFSSILKAGAFKIFAHNFKLKKLNPNSHLYTSTSLPENIPGRVFEVIEEIKANKQEIKKKFPSGIVNVLTRNFAIKADELKKKFNLKDGGSDFLIGTKVGDKFHLYYCRLLK